MGDEDNGIALVGFAQGAKIGQDLIGLEIGPVEGTADIGKLIPSLVSGSVIVSVVMSLPTVGPVLVSALQSQDQFLSGFILLFVAMLTLIGMLISDLLLAVLDPRIRLGGRASS